MKKRITAVLLCLCLGMLNITGFAMAQDPSVQTEETAEAEQNNLAESEEELSGFETESEEVFSYDTGEGTHTYSSGETDEPDASEEEPALEQPDAKTQEAFGPESEEEDVQEQSPMTVEEEPESTDTEAVPVVQGHEVTAEPETAGFLSPGYGNVPDTGEMILNRMLEADADGSYSLRMEAFLYGPKQLPDASAAVDFVLVLDQSGSMRYDLGNTTRQAAMKAGVDSFISLIAEKYGSASDHRIALVTFGSSASVLADWTDLDAQGRQHLSDKIRSLPATPNGATRTDLGVAKAGSLIAEDAYSGSNPNRQKVVIVFTDGVPTSSSTFQSSVADAALSEAQKLKNEGVTLYSIGVFDGADSGVLYGPAATYKNYSPIPCDGGTTAPGCYWGGSDYTDADIAAGNRFLNFLSSNFDEAFEVGIARGSYSAEAVMGDLYDRSTDAKRGKISGYKITRNFAQTAEGYYLTASDEKALIERFDSITQYVESAKSGYDASTVLKAVLSPYFRFTEDAAVEIRTADFDGVAFKHETALTGLSVSAEEEALQVSGFDFDENRVSETAGADGSFGKKLIVECRVEPKPGFLGGNAVPLTQEGTAVYQMCDGQAVEAIAFDGVYTDIPIPKPSLSAQTKQVYLTGGLSKAQLLEGMHAACGELELDLSDELFGLEAWQQAYVEIEFNGLSAVDNLTADTTYSPVLEITPVNEPVTDIPADTVRATAEAKILVYTPEVTFRDGEFRYGDPVLMKADLDELFVSAKWTHDGQDAKNESLYGAEPKLSFAYTQPGVQGERYETAEDVYVDVAVYISGKEKFLLVTDHTVFVHQDCDTPCGFDPQSGHAFILHSRTCSLTIHNRMMRTFDPADTILVTVEGADVKLQVAIPANESVTIAGLPAGSYTLTEDTDWSWRYEAGVPQKITIDRDKASATFANRLRKEFWYTVNRRAVNTMEGAR